MSPELLDLERRIAAAKARKNRPIWHKILRDTAQSAHQILRNAGIPAPSHCLDLTFLYDNNPKRRKSK